MLNLIFNIAVFLICFINFALCYIYAQIELTDQNDLNIFSTNGSGYQLLTNYHLFISLLFLGVIAVKWIGKVGWSDFICLVGLFLVCYQYRIIYLQKSLLFDSTDSFTELMRMTLPIDYFCFLVMIFLLFYQISFLFQYCKNYVSGVHK